MPNRFYIVVFINETDSAGVSGLLSTHLDARRKGISLFFPPKECLSCFCALLSLFLASGICLSVAYAQDTTPPTKKKTRMTAEEKFKALNKSGDGHLTLEEFLGKKTVAKEKAFKAADVGNKGYLTLDEFKTIYPKHMKKKAADKTPDATEKPAEKTPDKTPDKAPDSK